MERFNRAVDALVDAYLNDTLYRGSCCSCAVGNIVAKAHNMIVPKSEIIEIIISGETTYEVDSNIGPILWKSMVTCDNYKLEWRPHSLDLSTIIDNKKSFKPTGYSFEELQQVELVFMNNTSEGTFTSKEEIDQMHFNGLMAVVDLLISWEDQDIDRKEIESRFLAKA